MKVINDLQKNMLSYIDDIKMETIVVNFNQLYKKILTNEILVYAGKEEPRYTYGIVINQEIIKNLCDKNIKSLKIRIKEDDKNFIGRYFESAKFVFGIGDNYFHKGVFNVDDNLVPDELIVMYPELRYMCGTVIIYLNEEIDNIPEKCYIEIDIEYVNFMKETKEVVGNPWFVMHDKNGKENILYYENGIGGFYFSEFINHDRLIELLS